MDEDSAAGSRMPVMPDAAQHSQGQGHTAHTSHYAEAGAAGGSPAAEIEDSARDVRASPTLMRDLTGGRVYDPWRYSGLRVFPDSRGPRELDPTPPPSSGGDQDQFFSTAYYFDRRQFFGNAYRMYQERDRYKEAAKNLRDSVEETPLPQKPTALEGSEGDVASLRRFETIENFEAHFARLLPAYEAPWQEGRPQSWVPITKGFSEKLRLINNELHDMQRAGVISAMTRSEQCIFGFSTMIVRQPEFWQRMLAMARREHKFSGSTKARSRRGGDGGSVVDQEQQRGVDGAAGGWDGIAGSSRDYHDLFSSVSPGADAMPSQGLAVEDHNFSPHRRPPSFELTPEQEQMVSAFQQQTAATDRNWAVDVLNSEAWCLERALLVYRGQFTSRTGSWSSEQNPPDLSPM